MILCGKLRAGLGFDNIYCDPSTGDVVYDSDIMGRCLISNVSVIDPTTVSDEVFDKVIADLNADGVIFSDKYLIVLKDEKAEFREYESAMQAKLVVDYDLSVEYEGSIDR